MNRLASFLYYDLIARLFPGLVMIGLLHVRFDFDLSASHTVNGAAKLLVLIFAAYMIGLICETHESVPVLRKFAKSWRPFAFLRAICAWSPMESTLDSTDMGPGQARRTSEPETLVFRERVRRLRRQACHRMLLQATLASANARIHAHRLQAESKLFRHIAVVLLVWTLYVTALWFRDQFSFLRDVLPGSHSRGNDLWFAAGALPVILLAGAMSYCRSYRRYFLVAAAVDQLPPSDDALGLRNEMCELRRTRTVRFLTWQPRAWWIALVVQVLTTVAVACIALIVADSIATRALGAPADRFAQPRVGWAVPTDSTQEIHQQGPAPVRHRTRSPDCQRLAVPENRARILEVRATPGPGIRRVTHRQTKKRIPATGYRRERREISMNAFATFPVVLFLVLGGENENGR